VFFLREDNISLTEIQKETVATINHMFGGLIFTSDNIQNYDTRKNLIFDRMMNVSNKGIEKVECLKNGIVEILYNEENKKYLALVNFKNMKLNYNNNFGKLVEVFFDKENSINVSEYNKLEIEPYRSKVFAIKDYV
jgi:alpha-galactosidase